MPTRRTDQPSAAADPKNRSAQRGGRPEEPISSPQRPTRRTDQAHRNGRPEEPIKRTATADPENPS
jgi:hypothetical protein